MNESIESVDDKGRRVCKNCGAEFTVCTLQSVIARFPSASLSASLILTKTPHLVTLIFLPDMVPTSFLALSRFFFAVGRILKNMLLIVLSRQC